MNKSESHQLPTETQSRILRIRRVDHWLSRRLARTRPKVASWIPDTFSPAGRHHRFTISPRMRSTRPRRNDLNCVRVEVSESVCLVLKKQKIVFCSTSRNDSKGSRSNSSSNATHALHINCTQSRFVGRYKKKKFLKNERSTI